MSTGKEFSYTDWKPSQPDNQGGNGAEEQCVHIIGETEHYPKWNDAACDKAYSVLCEATYQVFANL